METTTEKPYGFLRGKINGKRLPVQYFATSGAAIMALMMLGLNPLDAEIIIDDYPYKMHYIWESESYSFHMYTHK